MTHTYHLKHARNSSHQQIANLVRQMNRGPVLDVGSAQGMLGQLIQGSGIAIDAVEPNPTWADEGRPYYRNTYVGMIESASLPERHYQVVVCADILEHTADPLGVLNQLRHYAADGAAFIVSLPNVAHLSVRLMLLLGLFPKMERGILDKTHLQFFTRRTAIDLLERAGLRVQRVSATGVPLELMGRSETSRSLLRTIGRLQEPLVLLLPRMFAFQWIFVATA